MFHSFIPFIFNNLFILVRVTVDLELVPGTLGVRWKLILDKFPILKGAMHVHDHALIHTEGQLIIVNGMIMDTE